VHQHAEVGWILGCYTGLGELSRMTQFKDKSAKSDKNITSGLFTYPVLMAADILLYQADFVPTGADQKQHLELARNIAIRFNGIYGDTFNVPEPYIPENGERIMSLQSPENKMSKSDPNPKGYILLLDTPDVIMKKVKSAVTDSLGTVEYDADSAERAGINNLINIYSAIREISREQVQEEFEGLGYGAFKTAVGEAIIEELAPLQHNFNELSQNEDVVREIYTKSAENASKIADKTLKAVYNKIGFVGK
jgi:tryptophanyl-tRNA synthetase